MQPPLSEKHWHMWERKVPISPVVPKGIARIRTQVSAAHTHQDLDFAVEKFAEVSWELGLPRAAKT